MGETWKPKKGQIDFTNAKSAPVLNCLVFHEGKMLIVKRSEKLRTYPNLWNGISGFLDDDKTVLEKAKEELREELGLDEGDIIKITKGDVFEVEDISIGKVWIVHPVRVEVKTSEIKLDWEASEFRWIDPNDILKHKTVIGFNKVVEILNKK